LRRQSCTNQKPGFIGGVLDGAHRLVDRLVVHKGHSGC
jgi:hypothetical protein